jgi:hypothetical protein
MFIVARIEPAPGTGRGLFVSQASARPLPPLLVHCRMSLFLRAAAISESRVARWAQGNRDEENIGCRTDRRVIYFVRSKGSKSRWRCCLGRGVGSGRIGSRGRGGRCGHWIYRRALDRAFLGSWAVGIAVAGSTCSTIQSWNSGSWNSGARKTGAWKTGACNAGASDRHGEFAATHEIFRDPSREERRAAGSGI